MTQRVPTLCDVIKGGSFESPMANWVTLAAAVSKPEFDHQMRRVGEWEAREFMRRNVTAGDYEELARQIAPNGLVRKSNETAEAFCKRVFERRPSWKKPFQEALEPPGRRWSSD